MQITRMMMAFCVLVTLSTASFADVPQTVSYQGRLTNSGGTPVPNGSYSVRFSLWSDSALGTESWNETQMVTVTDGLFSTELGSTSPFFGINCPGDCNEWLQIEVTIGGLPVTISPRSHLSATPWSLVSRSYYSETSSGLQKAKGVVKGIGSGSNPTQIVILEGDADGDGHADYSLNDSVSTVSASSSIGHDLDDDGDLDVVVASEVGPTGASFTVGDKPTSSQFGTLIESMVNIVEDRALLGLRSLNGLPPGTPVEDNIFMETDGSTSRHVIRGGMSGSTTGTIRMQATPDSAVSVLSHDADGDGIAEAWIDELCDGISDGTRARSVLGGRSGSTTATIRMQATPDSAVSVHEIDTDGDGVADHRWRAITLPTGSSSSLEHNGPAGEVVNMNNDVNDLHARSTLTHHFQNGDIPTQEQLVDASGSSFRAINTKGTGSTFRSITEATDSALSVLESDSDGDGNAESRANIAAVLNGNVVIGCATDPNDDGNDDNSAEMIVTPTTSSVAIQTKGTGADKNRVISSTTYPDSAVQVISSDEDGDGNKEVSLESRLKALGLLPPSAVHRMAMDNDDDGTPDNTIESRITPSTSSLAIKTKGTSAQRFSAGGDCDDTDASLHADCDSDGDGVADNSAAMVITPATSSMAIKTKGTGAQRFSAGGDCDDHDAMLYADFDADNDGVMESSISHTSDSGGTQCKGTIRLDSTPARISTNMTIERQTKTASISEIADLDGDGLTDRSAEMVTDIDGAGIVMDYQGIQARVGARKGWDGTIKGHLRLDNGPDMNVLFESDGDGYVATRFGIGVLEPSNPLEHSSGAHLTVGGTWTNASDENLKENFEKVDGSEILEKIEDLPIAEWNYKVEGNDIKHIGPTAQDFKEAFDLGDNDKSISTIDPSGVALVAIKELTKQNKDLKKKNAELADKLNDLQKQVEKLASALKK